MTTISWISTSGGDWSDGANWQGGVVPGEADDAILNLEDAETITISTTELVHSVTFADPAATYVETPMGSLTSATDVVLQGADANIHGTVTANGGDITVTVSGTIDVSSGTLTAKGVVSLNTPLGSISCFLSGTHITTALGNTPVETLIAGDNVDARFSGLVSIKWIGLRYINCRLHPEPAKIWPVRVRAGAITGTVPMTDLWLSPDHAVFVDGVLIPIKHLINGTSVVQVPMDELTYYHVELPEHDLLLAEGLLVESYLDTGDRANFANGGESFLLHPDFSTRPLSISAMRETFACAELVVTGPKLAAARMTVNALAGLLPQTSEPQSGSRAIA